MVERLVVTFSVLDWMVAEGRCGTIWRDEVKMGGSIMDVEGRPDVGPLEAP